MSLSMSVPCDLSDSDTPCVPDTVHTCVYVRNAIARSESLSHRLPIVFSFSSCKNNAAKDVRTVLPIFNRHRYGERDFLKRFSTMENRYTRNLFARCYLFWARSVRIPLHDFVLSSNCVDVMHSVLRADAFALTVTY